MTCKDCIHYEVCNGYTPDGSIDDFVEKFSCNNFESKSEWIHLPCKVGDTVYNLEVNYKCSKFRRCHGCITTDDIGSKYRGETCDLAKCEPQIVEVKMRTIYDVFHWLPYFGTQIYATKEEAEKALAERSK